MDNRPILVTKSSMPPLDEYIDEIRDIWDSHRLTNMGPKHEELQRQLKGFLGVDNIQLVTNGHMALELALQALNIQGEVITTPFTFASTTHAIVRNNLKPVFCDVNYDDYTIDTTKIEALINDNTCAIMPVHVYGNVCNIEEIQRLANKYGLKVIYDAAHTFGEKYKGEGIGTFGDASCFSFHATKVFNTIEGGAVSYHDEAFGKEICKLRNFGIKNEEVVDGVGANAKMNEFCAAMGICNLRHIDEEISKRATIVEAYNDNLKDVEGLKLNYQRNEVTSNYAYYPVVFEREFGSSRNEVFERLAQHNFFARKYFYPITNNFECFHRKYDAGLTPVALHLSKTVLTLPLYSDLDISDVEKICKLIIECKK